MVFCRVSFNVSNKKVMWDCFELVYLIFWLLFILSVNWDLKLSIYIDMLGSVIFYLVS